MAAAHMGVSVRYNRRHPTSAFDLSCEKTGLAAAGGYQGWKFGITQAQIKAVGDPARYYTFKNGDIGAGYVPFEKGEALLSFYSTDGYLERTMLVAYRGQDASSAHQAWIDAYTHLVRVCGYVEALSAGVGPSTPEAALAAYDKTLLHSRLASDTRWVACVCRPANGCGYGHPR